MVLLSTFTFCFSSKWCLRAPIIVPLMWQRWAPFRNPFPPYRLHVKSKNKLRRNTEIKYGSTHAKRIKNKLKKRSVYPHPVCYIWRSFYIMWSRRIRGDFFFLVGSFYPYLLINFVFFPVFFSLKIQGNSRRVFIHCSQFHQSKHSMAFEHSLTRLLHRFKSRTITRYGVI